MSDLRASSVFNARAQVPYIFDQPANLSLVVLGPSKTQRRVAKAWLDAWQPGATLTIGVE